MANILFRLDEQANPNYLASICRVGETHPIEGADRIVTTVINGYTMIVSKDMHEGDVVVYFPVETAISSKFLSANNLYEMGEFERNSNAEQIKELIAQAESLKEDSIEEHKAITDKIKSMCGFFNKYGRVRILKLKGIYSEGFVAGVDSLVRAYPELDGIDWESMVGTSFSHIGNDEVAKKFIPPAKPCQSGSGDQRLWKKRMKKLRRFDRIIDGNFKFHYDTVKINDRMRDLKPDDIVTISVKVHGTSVILANILCNKKLTFWEKVRKFLGLPVVTTEYANIYSSRTVIKNQYINPDAHTFYGQDIWGCVNRDFGPYVDKNMTVYGEIVGYLEGSQTMIQARHDYGCKPGEWKFMPYRISTKLDNGEDFEWNLGEVDEWTHKLVKEHPELENKVLYLDILYHGRFGDLYPDLDEANHWHENVLERMKNDRENFKMEELEPMCHLYEPEYKAAVEKLEAAKANGAPKKELKALENCANTLYFQRAPREGIVIRIDNDVRARAWKLKTAAHYAKEAEQHDEGTVDIEEEA